MSARAKRRLLSPALTTLLDMHTYMRPAGSVAEGQFIDRYIRPLPNAERDPFGNWHVSVGDSAILWSCHTDTVHRTSGRQRVHLGANGLLELAHSSKSNCLGSDDTAGVFLCREMILRGIPGHYMFHYGEERGGIGSSALAEEYPEFLQQFTSAIALDRQGTSDVITYQGWGRTASDTFAGSLADILNAAGDLAYAASDHGIYTDTAEYQHLIPECTNLSVGYKFAHSALECLDTNHVIRLLHALCSVTSDQLTIARSPGDTDRRLWSSWDKWDEICSNRNHPLNCTCGDDDLNDVPPYSQGTDRPLVALSPYLDPDYDAVVDAIRKDPKMIPHVNGTKRYPLSPDSSLSLKVSH